MKNKRLKYSVCIDSVFMKEKCSFTDAMMKAAETGFDAVEFWSWWDKDIPAIQKVLEKTELRAAAFCTGFINPGDKDLQEGYLTALRESISTAEKLFCPTLIVQAGWEYESFCIRNNS